MNAFTESNWRYVAEAHGGESALAGLPCIVLEKRPKVGRSERDWQAYSDALVDLLMLAGRGGAGLRMHVGYSGKGRFLIRDARPKSP